MFICLVSVLLCLIVCLELINLSICLRERLGPVYRSIKSVEMLSRVQFCTVFIHVSTSQRVMCQYKKIILSEIFLVMLLYSSFVINILEKFLGAPLASTTLSSSPPLCHAVTSTSLSWLSWLSPERCICVSKRAGARERFTHYIRKSSSCRCKWT